MKISTKGRYALRLMLDLALSYNGEYIPIKTVASRQDISEKYLEQIITLLSRSGFVKSSRGSQGGYMLSKNPTDYTVGMILRCMEGPLVPVSCLEYGDNSCPRAEFCATLVVWNKLKDAIDSVVDKFTLADLVEIHHQRANFNYQTLM